MPPKYADLGDLAEDDRITQIGQYCTANPGKLVGVITDDEAGKPERYIEKLAKRFPKIRVVDRFAGPTPNAVTIRVTLDPP